MTTNRTNLDDFQNNSSYIIFTTVFFSLSLIGLFILFQINKQKNKTNTIAIQPTIIPTDAPTLSPTEIIPSPEITIVPEVTSTLAFTASPTGKLKPTPTLKPTITPKPTIALESTSSSKLSTIPLMLNFQSPVDKFSVSYNSNRKVYQDKTGNINRYTFYSTKGSFAIHVSTSDWSWINTGRSFSTAFTIQNLPTSRYDIDTQTLVDFENEGRKYTIQCIHNGIASLKTECEKFIQSFKLL
jgi:hypothetical protein